VSGVFWGNTSDRLGRRAGFSLSFVALGAGALLFWAAPVMGGFVASVLLVGVSFRAAYIVCAASAGDYASPRFSAAAFGLMGMGAGLGNALGPLLGGWIADLTEVRWVFTLPTGGAAFAVLASTFLRRPRALARRRAPRART
jgi:MFS family permease